MRGLEIGLALPDLWQQEAVRLLRDGHDVVVHAPTGAGKTFVFEMLYPALRGQAIFTVPTRALANDKLAEWRARGWDVGIATGDISENLHARVIVATLETQKAAFLQRRGPRLLVIDEYQLLSDAQRGVNYELCLALAPSQTQLLLLSGSVENPQSVADWLERLGRKAALVRTDERPVPLEEIMAHDLRSPIPSNITGYWPKLVARAISNQLSPLLIFAPRRKTAEDLAIAIASSLPAPDPLPLSHEQRQLAGELLTKLLTNRVAWHHSGLSYAVRAGLIEPLAKRGHLRVIVSTTGLAAGINFSVRSVMVTGTSYQSGHHTHELRSDELLQMFGRAGRRGLDEKGYVLSTPDLPRLFDARPQRVRRPNSIDWPSFVSVMQAAVDHGDDPCSAAIDLTKKLFSTHEVRTGFEVGLHWEIIPCGLRTDAERARLVRRFDVEMLNSRNEWEIQPAPLVFTLERAVVKRGPRWLPVLSQPEALDQLGTGNLCKLTTGPEKTYGREITVATVADDVFQPTQPVRKLLRESGLKETKRFDERSFHEVVWPYVAKLSAGQPLPPVVRNNLIVAQFSFAGSPITGYLDSHGKVLIDPPTRRELPAICQPCLHKADCEALDPANSPAMAWRRLGLIAPDGKPTQRGQIFSYFSHGEGLAIAAALEKPDYPIDDLIFDLANIRAGHRFAGDDSPYGGRLGFVCSHTYERAEFPGYLEFGVPVGFGDGAGDVMRELSSPGTNRSKLLTMALRPGDIERAQLEWHSLLRQVAAAPALPWSRWTELQTAAARFLDTHSRRKSLDFPPLLGEHLLRYQR
ncbi:MAG TPA: DEAD/DEAH box helicase [Chthoniobacterales bacterium]|jgi:superfamily II DNA/RNA helicase